MLFQTLDDKKECVAVYTAGDLTKEIPSDISRTWSYSNFLYNYDIEYAQLYCAGKTLSEICPTHLQDKWDRVSYKLKAFLRSFQTSKVSLNENCFFDMTPKRFLLEYCEIKNEICDWVFTKYEKPENYNLLLNTQRVLSDIRYRKLNLNLSPLKIYFHENKAKSLFKRFSNEEAYCVYDLFGSKTGRLTTKPNSFPIHNLKKEYRSIIEPTNDLLVELDYNAAEARVVLGLLGKKQPDIDIHQYHADELYRGLLTRNDAKTRFFAWLYNPESQDYLSNREYDRDLILGQHYVDGKVSNIFNRNIEVDNFRAFNYLIQSTCADLVLEKMHNIHDILRDRKSYISFTLHDSIVIDLAKEDKHLINLIINEFKLTKFGKFKISISAGNNYGNLKLINN
tara:strand:- start:4885 stop:6069 length:1185 start_codon:yes stop_codon:yes gene_type:complete